MPDFGGSVFPAQEERDLEMAVRVFKRDGSEYAVVAEAELERHGWGTDPLGAIERYRTWRSKVAIENGQPSWDKTDIRVYTDEESGYPVRTFVLKAEWGVRATRTQTALRLLGQYLIDLANGVADERPVSFSGHLNLEELADG